MLNTRPPITPPLVSRPAAVAWRWLALTLLALGLLLGSRPRPPLPGHLLPLPLDEITLARVLTRPEVTALRQADSRTYDLGHGRFAAVSFPAANPSGIAAVSHATTGVGQELVSGGVIATADPETGEPLPLHLPTQEACLGNFESADGQLHLRRAYVQFPLPMLPANVAAGQIESAAFYAAPDGDLNAAGNRQDPNFALDDSLLTTAAVSVHPVDNSGWINDVENGAALPHFPPMGAAVAPLIDPAMGQGGILTKFNPADSDSILATGWDVTTVVQGWYAAPAANHGLGLRLADEQFRDYDAEPESGQAQRATFMCFPDPSAYAYTTGPDGEPIAPGFPQEPGLALLIVYTIPTLAADSTVTHQVPSTAPAGAYINQAHQVNLPPAVGRWRLLAARGNPTTGFPLANTPLALYHSNFGAGGPIEDAHADDGRDLPNYVVISPDAASHADLTLRVLPETSPAAPNHDDKLYDLQIADALPAPAAMPLPPDGSDSFPLALPADLVLGQTLPFEADTTVEVRLLTGTNMGPVDVRLFAPSTPYGHRDGAAGLPLVWDGLAYEIEFSVNAAVAGDWLLAVSRSSLFPVMTTLEVTVCANDDDVVRYPLDGECIELRRPDPDTFDNSTLKTIGSVRVYSPGGFNGACALGCETNNTAPDGAPVMPLIGHVDDDLRWVALKGGTATVFNDRNPRAEISPGTRLVMADFSDPETIVSLPVLRGEFETAAAGVMVAVSNPVDTSLLVNSPLPTADDNGGLGDKNGWSYAIDLAQARLVASGPVARTVQPSVGGDEHTFDFDGHWSITARGGNDLQGSLVLDQVAPLPLKIGVLDLYPPGDDSYTLEFDATDANPHLPQQLPPFQQLRFNGATLAQPSSLGGAQVAVQGVIQNPDAEPRPQGIHCGLSCFSLRGPDDTLAAPDPDYRMPDLLIQNEAALVAMAGADSARIYSADHPATAMVDAISFSFETFEAEVRTRQGPCPGPIDPFNPEAPADTDGPIVTIIEGDGFMNIPGVGESNTDVSGAPALEAHFTLCETSLRQVSLALTLGNAAVPLGNSGLFLNKISGTVSVTPEATAIMLQVGLYGLTPSAATSNVFINGWLLIDTRGLIDIHTNAVIRALNTLGYGATGHVWVGWSPLDMGFEVRGCLPYSSSGSFVEQPAYEPPGSQVAESELCTGDELLFGMIRAHLWQGAGWQDRYPHLLGTDPEATHFAGRFAADVNLAEGMVADWGLFRLPPKTIKVREVDLAAGEFCTNDDCTDFDWGVLGTYGLLGFKVGLYFDFGGAPYLHFILGSSDHCLIDEVAPGGGCDVGLHQPASLDAGVQAPAGPTVDEQFRVRVSEEAGSALFGLAWDGGNPTMTLIEPAPGNRVIDFGAPFPDVTVTITETTVSQQATIVVDDPLPGNWIVQLDQLAGVADYDFVFLANEAPAVAFNVVGPAPISDDEATLSWSTDIDDPGRYRVSFYWEARHQGRFYGGPIVERLPLTAAGSYDWDLRDVPGEGAGNPIQVYAQIENRTAQVIATCGGAGYSPDPTTPCSTMLHPDLGPAGDRIELGAILYEDVVAPAAPDLTNVRAQGETSVMVRWRPNDEPDLSGYLVTCDQPGLTRQIGIPPHYPGSSTLHEALQVNGLDAGLAADCSVQAYDAVGNLSPPSAVDSAVPTGQVPAPPEAPQSVGSLPAGVGGFTVGWEPAPGAGGYLLYYLPLDLSGGQGRAGRPALAPTNGYQALEGPSPLDVGDTTSFALNGLPPGATYEVWVRAYDAEGRTGPPSPRLRVTVGATNVFLPAVMRP